MFEEMRRSVVGEENRAGTEERREREAYLLKDMTILRLDRLSQHLAADGTGHVCRQRLRGGRKGAPAITHLLSQSTTLP